MSGEPPNTLSTQEATGIDQ